MGRQRSTFMAFGEGGLDAHLAAGRKAWESKVLAETADYLLGVNEGDYVSHIVTKYSLDTLEIDFDAVSVSPREISVRAEEYPSNYNVRAGETYTRTVYVYHLPIRGNHHLLRLRPSNFTTWHIHAYISDDNLCFEVGKFASNPEQINNEADQALRNLRQHYGYLKGDIDGFNDSLEFQVQQFVQSRKRHFMNQNQLLAGLKVPVKEQSGVPETFAIPASRRPAKIDFPRPAVHERGFEPEPTLDRSIYRSILEIIHDAGQNLERLPSTYRGKGEEDLRDHFIIMLEPHFRLEGSVTGETFNKSGKTDIRIRHQNKNVFAAECKFWKGAESYMRTIDQLLGYLTWRDSKAAVMLFDRNQGFSADLQTIQDTTPRHPSYLGAVEKTSESWFDFQFHLPGDRNRVVELAVLAFHFPRTKS